MDHGSQHKKIAVIAILALAAGLFAGLALSPSRAFANAFTDFFGKVFSPIYATQSPTNPSNLSSGSAAAVPLYAPTDDYETAVVNAVKAVSPAVVSITISENVPVLEQCPSDPFSNLPPDLRQLFGNDMPGFTQPCNTGKTQLQAVGGGSGFIISSDLLFGAYE